MTRGLPALGVATAVGLALAGCVRAQWIVDIATDAPIPSWGDRVLVEVLDSDGKLACDSCRHEVAVTAASFPVSVGIAPPASGGPVRLRARLYRSSQTGGDGLPSSTDLIDAVGVLPPLEGGRTRAVLPLTSFCFGQPADLVAHRACAIEANVGPRFGPELTLLDLDLDILHLRPGGINRFSSSCPSVVPDDMACVAPAAFLLGSPDSVGVDSDFPPGPERPRRPLFAVLVDRDELTVGALRQLVASGDVTASSSNLLRRGLNGVPPTCTYLGPTDASNDALPINCVSLSVARQACFALDKDLVSEGTWELAAGNGGRETHYPWGEERPTCDRSMVSVDATCPRAGPVAGGAPTDVTDAGVRNLGGNLAEWVDGIFVPYTDDCWNQPLEDSDCATDLRFIGWPGPWPYRGGSWDRRATSAASFARFASPDGKPSPSIGFRCSKKVLTGD